MVLLEASLKLASNSWSFSFNLWNAEIMAECHHIWLIFFELLRHLSCRWGQPWTHSILASPALVLEIIVSIPHILLSLAITTDPRDTSPDWFLFCFTSDGCYSSQDSHLLIIDLGKGKLLLSDHDHARWQSWSRQGLCFFMILFWLL